jgi:hypothetical protein
MAEFGHAVSGHRSRLPSDIPLEQRMGMILLLLDLLACPIRVVELEQVSVVLRQRVGPTFVYICPSYGGVAGVRTAAPSARGSASAYLHRRSLPNHSPSLALFSASSGRSCGPPQLAVAWLHHKHRAQQRAIRDTHHHCKLSSINVFVEIGVRCKRSRGVQQRQVAGSPKQEANRARRGPEPA